MTSITTFSFQHCVSTPRKKVYGLERMKYKSIQLDGKIIILENPEESLKIILNYKNVSEYKIRIIYHFYFYTMHSDFKKKILPFTITSRSVKCIINLKNICKIFTEKN